MCFTRPIYLTTKAKRCVVGKAPPPRWTRVGPCRDPLRLWYMQFWSATPVPGYYRRYFANRQDARVAQKHYRQTGGFASRER